MQARLVWVGFAILACMLAALPLRADDISPAKLASFQKDIQPFLVKHCYECHTEKGPESDIPLNIFVDAPALAKGIPTLEKAAEMLRSQKMPPRKQPQPTLEERKAIVAALEIITSAIDCDDPATIRDPGRVTIRRLNRAEYNNTIRDLLATDIRPADSFPVDDAGYGFDNIGDVLSIAPVLMEKYLAAANLVLEKAIFADPVVPPPAMRFEGATMDGSIPKTDPKAALDGGQFARNMFNGRVFNHNGELTAEYDFPADGEYVLQLRGYGRQRPEVQFQIDGENVGRPISLTEDQRNTKVYPSDKLKVKAGKHRITMLFGNSATKEEYDAAVAAAAAEAARAATQPAATAPAAEAADNVEEVAAAAARGRGAGGRGRGGNRGARGGAAPAAGKPMLGVVYIEVEGPLEVTPDRMPEGYRRVMVARPSANVSKSQAAEAIIRNFAAKAYRRPVADDEISRLMTMWASIDSSGEKFERSIHDTLQAVLASPHFIYRVEKDPGPTDPGGIRTLDEYELATRLSYFIWSSTPDDQLMDLAARNQLRANLDTQVVRMLRDPRSVALVDNFAGQWLQLRQMLNVTPDVKVFPGFDDALRQAMMKETALFFNAIMGEDRSILDFIDADFTFMNEKLAKHYGRSDITGEEFQRVALANNSRGGGLLTQASILTITSYPGRTSPVQRGKWVLENLLNAPPPAPPPNVPELKSQAEIKGTLRQRMELHRENPACATCHEQMDAIGFALENFDAIGAWRDKDGDAPIDPSGSMPGGQSFKGPAELKQILKSQQEQFCRCMTEKMLTFALGRGLEKFDRCTVDDIVDAVTRGEYKFSVLVQQIVRSDPFQKRSAKRGDQ